MYEYEAWVRVALRTIGLSVEALLSFHLFCLYQYFRVLLHRLIAFNMVSRRYLACMCVCVYWLILVIYVHKGCQDAYPTGPVCPFQAS